MTPSPANPLRVIDSHTGGEPTRTIVAGAPSLSGGDMQTRREEMKRHADWLRTALTLEPRGAPWMVGAILQKPLDPACVAGVIFFNNAGYLGMCGHGLIGVVATLAYQGRIGPGVHRFETAVGVVSARLKEGGDVTIENVVSYRAQKDLAIEVPGVGVVVGDVAYGGNWFFLTAGEHVDESRIEPLLTWTKRVCQALFAQGVRGDRGEVIDHVEVFAPASRPEKADARNFVLCPGGHYDRSPCGTGTSAKLACLAADGKLRPGQVWRQESVIGSVFEGSYRVVDSGIVPAITGQAFVTGETVVICQPEDPFRHGIGDSSPAAQSTARMN